MQYQDVLRKLIKGGKENVAHRPKWQYEGTNHCIFLDEDNIVKKTTRDWPQPFEPNVEELNANDWIVSDPRLRVNPTRDGEVKKETEPAAEREFTFHSYGENGEIVNTRKVKEGDLTEDDCFVMAEGFYQQFNLLPAKTQDFFIRKVINEAIAAQQEAVEEKTKDTPGRIITMN